LTRWFNSLSTVWFLTASCVNLKIEDDFLIALERVIFSSPEYVIANKTILEIINIIPKNELRTELVEAVTPMNALVIFD